jgi:hypothetical protein
MRFKQADGQGKDSLMSEVDFASEFSAMKRLWAAKLLVHAKDYAAGVKVVGGKRPSNLATSGITCANARKAYTWLTDKSDHPSSFVWICELFDLDPDRTRMRVFHNWREFLRLSKTPAELVLTEDDED